MSIYDVLLRDIGKLKEASEETSGLDDFLSGNDRVKLSSIDDFFKFHRISKDTLVHKSKKDLWKVSENSKGEVVIERLFDPNTKEPLKV